MPNRLASETSPYLQQHAHNPVDWYPWGPEAFHAARRQKKPIFLSVGYSTCYWCHVMERQCFQSPAVAAEMNQRFINIKVDREERPDVDQLYMAAVQVLSRQGGWPMSVFLTPDLRPFYGGTYFPPTDAHGRPGFVTVLRGVSEAYQRTPDKVEQTAGQMQDILQQLAEPPLPQEPLRLDTAFVDSAVERAVADYDPEYGGFGGAPKFPRQTLLELLLAYQDQPTPALDTGNRQAGNRARVLEMVLHTLVRMAAGGIRDHLGGGFHRYSTDRQWLVPHFEIMLYDNALLAWLYSEAYRQTEQLQFASVAREILDFVLSQMTSPQGAFYTAFDAETGAREGATYVWTPDQVRQVLDADDAVLFQRVYGMDQGPNFSDPHHDDGRPQANVLYLPRPLPEAAREMGLTPQQLEQRLVPLRARLLAARQTRPQPLLDTKIITSWNALMIRALSHAGSVLAEKRYLAAARKAADFLLRHHRTADGGLYHVSRDGNARHEGFLDDYAYLVQALLSLRDESGLRLYEDRARALALMMCNRFQDHQRGGFYFTPAGAQDLIVRQKVAVDSPLPSGGGVAAMALLELNEEQSVQRTLQAFAHSINEMPESTCALLQASMLYLRTQPPLELVPEAPQPPRPPSPQELAAQAVGIDTAWVDDTDLRLHLTIAQGYHLNAQDAGGGLVPTELRLEQPDVSIEYPPSQSLQIGAGQTVAGYSGRITLRARFARGMTGRGTLHGMLRYQACTHESCLPPASRTLEIACP